MKRSGVRTLKRAAKAAKAKVKEARHLARLLGKPNKASKTADREDKKRIKRETEHARKYPASDAEIKKLAADLGPPPEIEPPLSKDPEKAMKQIMARIPKRDCLVCHKAFTPALTMSGRSTELHCSPECAAEGLRKKGLLPRITPAQLAARQAQDIARAERAKQAGERLRKVRPQRSEPSPEQDAQLTAKWGPKRSIKKVLEQRAKSKRCVLECGHEATVPAKSPTWRCMKCRKSTQPKAS